jgi:hypothetical protein
MKFVMFVFENWVLIDIQVNVCKSFGAGADAEEICGASRPWTKNGFAGYIVGGPKVSEIPGIRVLFDSLRS